jgi:hypothetical protein
MESSSQSWRGGGMWRDLSYVVDYLDIVERTPDRSYNALCPSSWMLLDKSFYLFCTPFSQLLLFYKDWARVKDHMITENLCHPWFDFPIEWIRVVTWAPVSILQLKFHYICQTQHHT